jgi:hypothetical protein
VSSPEVSVSNNADSPPENTIQGWDLNNLTFAPLSPFIPEVLIQAKCIQRQDISNALRRIEQCFQQLGVQAEFEDNPVGARLRTLDDIDLDVQFFKVDDDGVVAMSIQRRRGDHLTASRYLHKICNAALGIDNDLDKEPQATHGPPNPRLIYTFENFLRRRASSSSSSSSSSSDTDTTGSNAPLTEEQKVLENTLGEIYKALDQVDNNDDDGTESLDLAASFQSVATLASSELDVAHHETSAEEDDGWETSRRRGPLRIPRSSMDAYRNCQVVLVDSTGSNPRQEKVYVMPGDRTVVYKKTQFLGEETTPFGRLLYCETLTRTSPRERYSYQEVAPARKWESVVAIVEVAKTRLDGPSLLSFMTTRMLECTQTLEDASRMYFVCPVHIFFTLANTALSPPSGPRSSNNQNELSIQHRRLVDNLKGWFRNLVLSVRFALQGGFCPVNLDPNGANHPRYLALEILLRPSFRDFYSSQATSWSLGAILYEALTGLSFPIPTTDPTYLFWVTRSGYFNARVPDNVIDELDRAEGCHQFDARIVGQFFASIRAVHGLSKDAGNLLTGLLQEDPGRRLSIEQILDHKWLAA